jgi:hypothetical protein
MEFQRVSKARTTVKLFAAVIGGSAVVTLAALGVSIGGGSGGDAVAKSSSMSVGATTTETTPSSAPATGMAKPTIKGPAPLPSEEEAAK